MLYNNIVSYKTVGVNMDMTRLIETIRAVNDGGTWLVIGTTTLPAPALGLGEHSLKATLFCIDKVKRLLSEGKEVRIPHIVPGQEVREEDLMVDVGDDLERRRNSAISEVYALTGQNAMEFNVLDSMDYLDAYMKLLAAGIFITDKNREDKYLEIIQRSQEVENPGELKDGATFDEEQEWMERKKSWDEAQDNLRTLETYLNSKDKMSKLKYVKDQLAIARNALLEAKTGEEIDGVVAGYRDITEKYRAIKHVNV